MALPDEIYDDRQEDFDSEFDDTIEPDWSSSISPINRKRDV